MDSISFGNLSYEWVALSVHKPCGCRPEWPEITPLMLETSRLIEQLYELPNCSVGGPLHILTDDQNVDDDNLAFCWGAVFDELGPRSRGWWREGQTPDDAERMVRTCCAILWAFGAMTLPERHVVAGEWPLTGLASDVATRRLAPHQDAYLLEVEWGDETERPDWVCDVCWYQSSRHPRST